MADLAISSFEDLLHAATSMDAAVPLQRMVDAIKAGAHGSFIPFDRAGRPVVFE